MDGAITAYVYDGADIALEFDGAGALLARYSHGDRVDQPLTMERGGQSYFYHTDHLGSIRLVTDAAGAVVNSYDYDAYGNFEAISETVASLYAYTGREYDGESGLYYVRARYYDPQTGRFLSEDPIGFAAADANLYRYVFNNPTNLTDPSGRIIGKLLSDFLKDFFPGPQPSSPQACPAPSDLFNDPGMVMSENSESDEESAPTRDLEDPRTWEGAPPEELTDALEESDQYEPPQPLQKGDGEKFTKKGTKGSDQVRVNKGYPNHSDPLHQGPYATFQNGGNPAVRVPLAGNPLLKK